MNKNTIVGGLLMAIICVAWWFSGPSPEEIAQAQREKKMRDSLAQVAIVDSVAQEEIARQLAAQGATLNPQDSAAVAAADSIENAHRLMKWGNLANAAVGEARQVVIENSKMKVVLSTKGGQPAEVILKEYEDYKGDSLRLFTAEGNEMYYTFYSIGGKYLTTEELYFEPVAVTDSSAAMRLRTNDGAVIDFVYNLKADSYVLDYTIHSLNLDRMISPTQASLSLTWNQRLPRTELGNVFEGRYSQMYYKYAGQSSNDLSSTSADDETLDSRMTWISFENQFFSSMLISNDLFSAGRLSSLPIKPEQDEEHIKQYKAELEFDIDLKGEQIVPMAMFLGPKDYYLLKSYNDVVAEQIGKSDESLALQNSYYLGWPIVRHVNRWIIIPLFWLLNKLFSNYGIIILLMTLFIKLITLPMTYKSYMSSAKMRIANKLPEAIAIQEKYPNQEDAMTKQQELMAFYGKLGVSPTGGCLPMLIQWPVLLALFYFFPTSIELRHQPFLWADDLSTYDAILTWDANIPVVNWIFGNHLSLFCLLMTVTNIFYTWLMQKQNPAQQGMPGMKMMMYVMPLMFLFVLNNYSAGLSYYYFLSTLFGIIITYGIRWSINEDKILETLKKNLKNPKKGAGKANGWMARLQEMQRQQEAALKKQREEQARKARR